MSDIGQFSGVVFHPTIFDTGVGGNQGRHQVSEDKDQTRFQILREDEEIITLMLAVGEDE